MFQKLDRLFDLRWDETVRCHRSRTCGASLRSLICRLVAATPWGERWRPQSTGADGGHRTTRGGHSPLERTNTAPTGRMKLLNIAHFHPSRLLRLFEPAGALKGSRHVGTDFWISFRQLRRRRSPIRELDVAAGWAVLIICGYFSERGFHRRSAEPSAESRKSHSRK